MVAHNPVSQGKHCCPSVRGVNLQMATYEIYVTISLPIFFLRRVHYTAYQLTLLHYSFCDMPN
jgi:hypothetical protein